MDSGFQRIACATVLMAGATFTIASGAAHRPVNGTIWVANRGAHTIRGFDADSGAELRTIEMATTSQLGDLAYAKGKLYVSEEFAHTPTPSVAVVDVEAGTVLKRFFFAANSRPHHVHASQSGTLVAVGLYGTDTVAVIDTRDDTLLGPWDTNPSSAAGRAHAGGFSENDRILYVTSDTSNELIALDPRSGDIFWRMTVPGAHELVIGHNGKTAYVSRRTAGWVSRVDLVAHDHYDDVVHVTTPDTLQLSSDEKLLTVGLRTSPAQMAVVDTSSFDFGLVTLSTAAGSIAGHQWTAPSGRFTFATFEGANAGVAVIDHFAGHQVVQQLPYPGRPHGVTHALP